MSNSHVFGRYVKDIFIRAKQIRKKKKKKPNLTSYDCRRKKGALSERNRYAIAKKTKRKVFFSPVLVFAAGLAGLQHGRRSPRIVRVAHVYFYGLGGAVLVVYFPGQGVDVWKKKNKRINVIKIVDQ